MKPGNKLYTIITGASKGLGLELARSVAALNRNLILVSLPGEDIRQTSEELMVRYKVDVLYYETDLTQLENIDRLSLWISRHYAIDMLINNAGTGGSCDFTRSDTAYLNTIMQLNMMATVMLTRKLIPLLQQQNRAYILNIASMASFGPMPYKTVYPASKAFIYSFSRGLYAELRHTNIFVSVAHPGPMATTPEITARIRKHNRLIRTTVLSPEKTAQICIRQLLKEDALILPGFMNKVSWLVIKMSPVWLRLHIFRRSLLKELRPQIV
ncbi:SDR family NAD(P)-dependent oxidoreductase [Saccharicrinis sp. FJH54]|uniref:SDR family NAD(P)-dependent oxidoreductase n=1 Tax=Saccharicrinis sp. FJH54 TaxID=3344665 RepID=UPI0035D3EE05